MGCPGDYAPFAALYPCDERLNGSWALRGADVEAAVWLAASLQLRPVFVRVPWRGLLEAVRGGSRDSAVADVAVNERSQLRTNNFQSISCSVWRTRRCRTIRPHCQDHADVEQVYELNEDSN